MTVLESFSRAAKSSTIQIMTLVYLLLFYLPMDAFGSMMKIMQVEKGSFEVEDFLPNARSERVCMTISQKNSLNKVVRWDGGIKRCEVGTLKGLGPSPGGSENAIQVIVPIDLVAEKVPHFYAIGLFSEFDRSHDPVRSPPVSPLPSPVFQRFGGSALFSFRDGILGCGGVDVDGAGTTQCMFTNLHTGVKEDWAPAMPYFKAWAGTSLFEGRPWILGGLSPLADTLVLAQDARSWEQGPALPPSTSGQMCAIHVDSESLGEVTALAVVVLLSRRNTVWTCRHADGCGEWTLKGVLPGGDKIDSACAHGRSSDGHDLLVVAGGSVPGSPGSLSDSADIVDLHTGVMTAGPKLPLTLYQGAMVTTCDLIPTGPCSVLYVGGSTSPGYADSTKDVYELDADLGGWTKRADLELPEKANFISGVSYWRP